MKTVSIFCAHMRGNLGDYAIVDASARFLNDISEDLKIKIAYHGYTIIDEHRTKKFLETAPKNIELSNRTNLIRPRLYTKILRRLKFSDKFIYRRIFNLIINKLKKDIDFINTIKNSDLIIIADGGHYGSPIIALNMLAQIKVASKYTKNVICFSQTVPPNWLDEKYSHITLEMLSLIEIFPLREQNSYKELLKSNFNSIKQFSDIVFYLNNFIDIPKKRENKIRKVGLVMANTGTKEDDDYTNKMVELYRKLEKYQCQPYIITTTDDVDKVYLDRIAIIDINIRIEKPKLWVELVDLFSSLDLIFTNRFHGVVFSILVQTAVIPIVDVDKTKFIYETANLKYCLKSEFDITQKKLTKYIANTEAIVDTQNKYLEHTKEQLKNFEISLKECFFEE